MAIYKRRVLGLKIAVLALLLAWIWGEVWVYMELSSKIYINTYKDVHQTIFSCSTGKEYGCGDTFLSFAIKGWMLLPKEELKELTRLSLAVETAAIGKNNRSFTAESWKYTLVNFYLINPDCEELMHEKFDSMRNANRHGGR
ncbi:MAG: hypothetical protein AAGI38_07730 [Bacteroidota bacterium]